MGNLYIIALDAVDGEDTSIFLESEGEAVKQLFAVVCVSGRGANIVDNCYRSLDEVKAAWPEAVSPEAPTIEGERRLSSKLCLSGN